MPPAPRRLTTSPFAAKIEPEQPVYTVGERVVHNAFGLGRVIGVEGTRAVSVDFTSSIERVELPTAKLSPC